MKVVLTGGGTGGHIYPAVAIGRQLQREEPGTELLYIGTGRGLESRIVPELGIPFEAVDITGFRRKLSLDNIKTIIRFVIGVRRARGLLRRFKPDVVIGTGGYVCGPVVYAAAKLGIPTVIHEQNVDPGLTNKFLSRYADTVAVSFEESLSRFGSRSKVLHTGNPCATNVLHADRAKGFKSLGIPEGSRLVLFVGGSRGAKAFNDTMVEMAPQLDEIPGVQFVFVTGETYYEKTSGRIASLKGVPSDRLHIVPYLNNMAEVLAASSLVVSRSGASSLAEITALGVPSILIPSPNVTGNHQEPNARSLADAGAAVMILERDLTGQKLLAEIGGIVGREDRLQAMGEAARKLGMPQSANVIASEIKTLIKRK
ncbi:undecaprenyldiphospho-muramoylpentapeptide beta-N-acetylglucosaminyltransferase [Paenibacillus sambharensis]|uniref:UDP-N-acetylglucosamine--N-acetylmuramyl-(pentapeptide) pyrophosphoryl-undecaprenol N-acetylglucosamine transferase n=1 Tax=Paenibacillus sambharensis TaxID=1803190 RepID=A0A2W1L4R1_9BACL|nr:undecaprenyldiphospho-muramoylpentapeptide beta-N-acetylglucosaminyltransferase [Paenibacillus sambharensis]PZD93889.1 undecaprenyldiphospho-muramoylpentapeptide beta-N-acetylglucosaminyltransferase [Paenibacillus sambharensis]